MENKVSIWKHSVNYGLIGGFLTIAYSLILWLSGLMEMKSLSMLGFLILAFVIYLGAKTYREKYNEGWLTYSEAFKIGFFVVLIVAVLSIIYQYIFLNYIDPQFVAHQLAEAENRILEARPDISDEDLKKAMDLTAKFTSTSVMAIMGFVSNLIFGSILALIVAIFAKKVNPADQ